MGKPRTTRLRYVASRDPNRLVEFLNSIGFRVQIYGSPQWNGKKWFLWFVPPDEIGIDIVPQDLDS